ncbi:MAG: CaiB/BaiF CoA-transferase family protein, partial [Rhodospirillales bacterium]|nr:CaiB/BaiF CoA-transferase family protein [Rhodospirillales bacterium]
LSTTYMTCNATKRSVPLNLKDAADREAFLELVAGADVLVENYRSGALAALGLGYEEMSALNPTLIYCSMTGYGQDGPKGRHTAYDQVIQAASGLMSVSGTAEVTPLMVGAPVVDYASGTMAAFAVASALYQRAQTGHGQYIDFSMLDTALILMASSVTAFLHDGALPSPSGNKKSYAGNSCYETADGLVMLGAFNRRQHERMWRALDRPDLAELSSWDAMAANREMLSDELASILATRPAAQWETFFNDHAVPAARVRTLAEALDIDQLDHRDNLLHTFEDAPGVDGPMTVPVAAFRYAHGGPRADSPPPAMGADTDAVLGEAGYGANEIAALRAAGVI